MKEKAKMKDKKKIEIIEVVKDKGNKKHSKGFYIMSWAILALILFGGYGWALSTVTDNSANIGGTNVINASGVFVDTKTKITTEATVTVGRRNDSLFTATGKQLDGRDYQAFSDAVNYMNKTHQGGTYLIRAGNYTINQSITFASTTMTGTGGYIWVKGEGFGTRLMKNASSTGYFALGNPPIGSNGTMKYMRFSDFLIDAREYGGINTTILGRLLNGNPPDPTIENHNTVFIDHIIGIGTDSRFINLDADNLFIDHVIASDSQGGYGGEGNWHWIDHNRFSGSNKTGAEIEGIDENHIDYKYNWLTDNYIENYYEQAIDDSHVFSHIRDNTVIVADPTDQGGITFSNNDVVIGNIVLNISEVNGEGGLQYYATSYNTVIMGNLLIAKNKTINCATINGDNATIVGNVFQNCTLAYIGSGKQNQVWGNWFEPDTIIDESQNIGANYLKEQIRIMGANVNVTRNMTVTGQIKLLPLAGNAQCSADNAGSITYNSTSNRHMGCNSTNWNNLY